MRQMKMWRWVVAATVAAMGMVSTQADQLTIESFDATGQLVYGPMNGATNYRVEWASSPAGPWMSFAAAAATLDSMPATDHSVTCSVPMCFRVVAEVTNALPYGFPVELPTSNQIVHAFIHGMKLYAVARSYTVPCYTVYSTYGSEWTTVTTSSEADPSDVATTVINIGGDLYFIRVEGSAYVWRYSIDSGAWDTSLTPISPTRYRGYLRTGGSAAVHNGIVYIFGGGTGPSTLSPFVDKYDPASGVGGTWTACADHAVRNGSLCATAGDYIYLIGGSDCGDAANCISATCEKYDPGTDAFLPMMDFPKPICGTQAGGALVHGDIFVLGGKNARWEAGNAEVHTYSIAADNWTRVGDMQKGNRQFTALLFDGKIYCMGGNMSTEGTPDSFVREIEVYSP